MDTNVRLRQSSKGESALTNQWKREKFKEDIIFNLTDWQIYKGC